MSNAQKDEAVIMSLVNEMMMMVIMMMSDTALHDCLMFFGKTELRLNFAVISCENDPH